MAEFDKENLKDEEKIGGFDANSPDDESFSLEERDEYPGELPDFSDEQKSPDDSDEALEQSNEGLSKAPKIDVPTEGSVWDLFDDDDSKEPENEESPQEGGLVDVSGAEDSDKDFEPTESEEELPGEIPEEKELEVSEEPVENPETEDGTPEEFDQDEVSEVQPSEDDPDDYDLDQFLSEDTTEELQPGESIELDEFVPEESEAEPVEEDIEKESAEEIEEKTEDSAGTNIEGDEDIDNLAAQLGVTSDETADDTEDSTAINETDIQDNNDLAGGDDGLQDLAVESKTKTDTSDLASDEDESTGKRTTLQDLEDQELEVDEGLKDLLKQDIEDSKAKKTDRMKKVGARVAVEEVMSEDEHEEKLQNFKPVDVNEAEEVISLGNIKAKHPSTAGLEEGKMPSPEEEVKPAKAENESKERQTEKGVTPLIPVAIEEKNGIEEEGTDLEDDEEENKKRGFIPWGTVATVAASLLLISLLTYGTYYIYTEWDWFTGLLKTDNAQVKENLAVSEGLTDETDQEEDKGEELNENEVKETKPEMDLAEPGDAIPEPDGQIAENTDQKIEKPAIKKPVRAKEMKKPVVNKRPQKVASVNKKGKKTARDIRKVSSGDATGVYTVEIYSTPSLEDAEEWLTKLKGKNVPNARIVAHKKRDKNWYRVRFGSFTSREEAKQEALRLGYAQTWIDRVR